MLPDALRFPRLAALAVLLLGSSAPSCAPVGTGGGWPQDGTGGDPPYEEGEEPDYRDYGDSGDVDWPQEPATAPADGPRAAAAVSAAALPRQAGVMLFLWHRAGRPHEPGSLTPTLGMYDSRDPEVQRKHIQWWKDAKINFVTASWWGSSRKQWNREIDEAFRGYLQRCEELGGIQMCVYLEEIPGGLAANVAAVREFAESPAYYRLFDKPVLFVYDRVMRQCTQEQMMELAREFFCVYTGPPVVKLPADVGFGCHWFKIPFIREQVLKLHYRNVSERDDLVLFPLIYHGFDNTRTRKATKVEGGVKWPKEGSSPQWFQHQLDLALKANTRVLLFPWNELGERSAFEPTQEFGDTYYKAMKDAVASFLKQK